jgi:hypothetical protein
MDLAVAKLGFALRAVEPPILPPYKGSTLRGGFGATLPLHHRAPLGKNRYFTAQPYKLPLHPHKSFLKWRGWMFSCNTTLLVAMINSCGG